MMSEEKSRTWAEEFVRKGAKVLHTPTHVIGVVYAIHPPNEKCNEYTIEVLPGHRFLAEKDNFIELSAKETHFHTAVETGIAEVVRLVLTNAKESGMPFITALQLTHVSLNAQMRILEAQINEQPDPAAASPANLDEPGGNP